MSRNYSGNSRVEAPVDYRVSRNYSGISRAEGPVDYRVSRNYSGISRELVGWKAP